MEDKKEQKKIYKVKQSNIKKMEEYLKKQAENE